MHRIDQQFEDEVAEGAGAKCFNLAKRKFEKQILCDSLKQ